MQLMLWSKFLHPFGHHLLLFGNMAKSRRKKYTRLMSALQSMHGKCYFFSPSRHKHNSMQKQQLCVLACVRVRVSECECVSVKPKLCFCAKGPSQAWGMSCRCRCIKISCRAREQLSMHAAATGPAD